MDKRKLAALAKKNAAKAAGQAGVDAIDPDAPARDQIEMAIRLGSEPASSALAFRRIGRIRDLLEFGAAHRLPE